jgi:hypothetical protein
MCKKIKKLKKRPGPTKGCRATDRYSVLLLTGAEANVRTGSVSADAVKTVLPREEEETQEIYLSRHSRD